MSKDALLIVDVQNDFCPVSEMKEAGAIFTTTDAILNFYIPPSE